MATAIGIAPHTGWAWLVRVSGQADAARIESRQKVVACDVLEGQLYHRAAERQRGQAEFLAERRAIAIEQASRALAPHLAGALAAAVLGKQLALPPLERIVAAHPLTHAAEGELWRAIFAEACRERGVTATRSTAEEVQEAQARLHGRSAVVLFLARGKRELGAPWSLEPQQAALAGWSLLPRR
jgi:hypothetical protein